MVKNPKLIWQIFPAFLVITVVSLVGVTLWSTHHFKSVYLENSEKELTIRAQLLQQKFADLLSLAHDQTDYIDEQCKSLGNVTGTRVTVMLPSGKVIGDSFAEIGIMENHKDRPEIRDALKRQKGVSSRYSATLRQQMMYIALPVLTDQKVIAVVRTAVSITAIDKKIKSIRNRIFFGLFLTILAAAVVSLMVTRRITQPVEEMKKGAEAFARGDLSRRLAAPASEELSQLSATMNRMAENLQEKIRTLKSRTMELEAVHASMQEGVIAIDGDERIITINEAAAKVFGFSASGLTSRYVLEMVRNMDLQRFIQAALATHEPVEETIDIAGDGTLIINIHSSALYDADNHRMGTLIIFHDITRMRRLEIMHKDFAANVSHELKTPLTTIKGFMETVQGMLKDGDPEGCMHFMKIMDKNVNRMISLINDLLALSRLERMQGTDVELESQEVSALIQGALRSCSAQIEKKEISVVVDCPETMTVTVDTLLMEQAIFNLLNNAVKYAPAGSRVCITASDDGNGATIAVSDEGPGIASEHLPKIFNRFYRVDKSRSRDEGGTGLGLAIVKHILQYHQGTIQVDSQKGKGSTFTLWLPRTA